MKKIVLLLSVLSLLAGCCAIRQNRSSKMLSNKLPDSISYSNGFKMFWNDYVPEYNSCKTKVFQPSKDLIDNYHLEEFENGQYYLRGLLKYNSNFDMEQLKKEGVKIKMVTTSVATFQIPISKVSELLHHPGIVYIETSRQVYEKQQ